VRKRPAGYEKYDSAEDFAAGRLPDKNELFARAEERERERIPHVISKHRNEYPGE
jgi:hypothetical protein